jgi:predicted amidohydrolase
MQDLKITLVQLNPLWHNIEENLAHFSSLFSSSGLDTDVIMLPEMFTTGFTMESGKVAEPMHGRTHSWMQEQAVKLNAVICGSAIIRDEGNFYNRFLWVEPDGHTSYYDKRHLFRMADENKFYAEGTELITINYKGWKLRPLVCYDLRFPVWARNSVQNDVFAYDILMYVANWPQVRVSVWTTLLEARALENYAYCLGVNRVGEDEKGIIYNGQSMAFDPKGNKLCKLEDTEATQTVTLKYEELAGYRKKFPVFLDADNYKLEL